MGLYSFQPRFVPFIRSGAKTHTIRATRKYPDKPGNTIHCFTGLRTKKAKLLGRFECVKVEEIEIQHRVEKFINPDTHQLECVEWDAVRIDDHELCGDERENLARRDGFNNFSEMMSFWDGRLPFSGHIIHWRFREKRV